MKKICSGHTRIWIFIYQIQLSISQEYYLVLLIYKKNRNISSKLYFQAIYLPGKLEILVTNLIIQ